MSNVYCIIVTYNAMKWVDKCFSSLLQSSVPINIVAIDNGSKDSTISYIRNNYPKIHLIVNNDNKGFGQANNQGIEYAYKQGASHFFLLNQDAWIEPNCIENLVRIQNEHQFAIVSPIHLNGPGDSLDFGFYEASVERIHNIEFISDIYLNNLKEFYFAEDINAAAWMISRKTIETIGGFDPLYFHYGEDMNYCQRLKYHKQKMVFVPSALIHHDRLQYGNIVVYKKGVVMMTLLLNHSDINYSLMSISNNIKTHILLLLKILKYFIQLKWGEMFHLLSDMCLFFCKLPQIVQSRKQNRILTHNWLDI